MEQATAQQMRKDLIHLLRTPYEKILAWIEDVLAFVLNLPNDPALPGFYSQVDAMEDVLKFGNLPDRDEAKVEKELSISKDALVMATDMLPLIIREGNMKPPCDLFEDNKPVREVAEEILKELNLIGKKSEAARFLEFSHIVMNHTPYSRFEDGKTEINSAELTNLLLENNPETFARINHAFVKHLTGENEVEVYQWLSDIIEKTAGETEKLAILQTALKVMHYRGRKSSEGSEKITMVIDASGIFTPSKPAGFTDWLRRNFQA